jgi:hypothetical protein
MNNEKSSMMKDMNMLNKTEIHTLKPKATRVAVVNDQSSRFNEDSRLNKTVIASEERSSERHSSKRGAL